MDTKGWKLHPDLKKIIREIEKMNYEVDAFGFGRTFMKQIEIYKNKAKDNEEEFDIDKVPLDSAHFAHFENSYLYGIDFRVKTTDNHLLSGLQIYGMVLAIAKRLKIFVGCGVGKLTMHLDVYNRNANIKWYYYGKK